MQYEAIMKKYIGLTNVHYIRSVIIASVLQIFLIFYVYKYILNRTILGDILVYIFNIIILSSELSENPFTKKFIVFQNLKEFSFY